MKQLGQPAYQPQVNHDEAFGDLKDKFARLIYELGYKNTKGTERYAFEVDFMYVMHEFENGPPYLRFKLLEKAAEVTNRLAAKVRNKQPVVAA